MQINVTTKMEINTSNAIEVFKESIKFIDPCDVRKIFEDWDIKEQKFTMEQG